MSSNPDIGSIQHPLKFFIGGEWTQPSSNATIEVRDSSTEEVFLTVAAAKPTDINKAVSAARDAFDRGPWPRLSHQERAVYLTKIADGFIRHAGALADTWTAESGAIRTMSAHVSQTCSNFFKFYAGLAGTFEWEEETTSFDGLPSLIVREPVGVVAAIVPWNSPAIIMVNKAAPALIAGCSVVIKASPEAPAAPYIFAQICEEAGLPPGVVNVVTADRDVSELLVRHPGIDKVSFTGSTAAGRRIASACGERIARCTLELGGKSPAIILDDFDVGEAALALAQSAPRLTGQVCSSVTRIIIGEKRHDQFVDALTAALALVRVGDPYLPETQMGPLATAVQRDRVERYIEKGKSEGARVALGGGRPKHLNRGYYIEPTVFAGVDNSSTIAQEEIFGPVLSVIAAKNEAQAVEIANDTIFGLNSVVFTNDEERAYTVGRNIRAGTVAHNAFRTNMILPFGGFKQSGVGRECGKEGIYPYLETKTMILAKKPSLRRTTLEPTAAAE